MKKRKISFFDLGLLLLIALIGLGAYFLVHGDVVIPPSTADPLLEDIRRNSDRYTDQELLAEIENYVIQYRVALPATELQELEGIAAPEDDMFNGYNQTPLGTLKKLELQTVEGETHVVATVELYAVFTKTAVTAPSGSNIRVGQDIELTNAQGQSLGMGKVLFISH